MILDDLRLTPRCRQADESMTDALMTDESMTDELVTASPSSHDHQDVP